MRKILLLGLILLIFLMGGLFYFKKEEKKSKGLATNHPPNRLVKAKVKESKAIFVPEWSLATDRNLTLNQSASADDSGQASQVGEYGRWIYFPSSVHDFPSGLRKGKEQWFTVKITELPDEKNWPEVVQREINIAKDYNWQGIVLDLEINGLPTDNLVKQINNFVKYFYTEVKTHDIKLAVAVYGDTFYRHRPYDIRFINDNSDEVMVMAYDFHKSRGEPGPNFPYDEFQTMINDFLQFVPPGKLTVIFGMYGYDWVVDEKKRPITPAHALTLNEIRQKFLTKCQWKDCVIKRDNLAKETEINYTVSSNAPDDQGIYLIDYHIVWFEDEESVKVKTDYLREKGIGSVAYWALGYF